MSATNKFAIIYDTVWDAPWSGNEKLVYSVLRRFACDDAVCFPTISSIAQKAGISVRTAQRTIKELERRGAIEVKNRRGGLKQRNFYVLLHDHEHFTRETIEEGIARADRTLVAWKIGEKIENAL